MNMLLLGYGTEGQAAEKYFRKHFDDVEFEIWQDFDAAEIRDRDYSSYDLILRSPSVPPLGLANESSLTRYFFDKCPCPIIGVTATKGKGTTCSFIHSILKAFNEDAYLVGNIGVPAIEVLDDLKPNSVVVYEMSSFQLWDMKVSPHVAVIGQLEPDHLNVHRDYDDYLSAKANVCLYQSENDYVVYFANNPESVKIAEQSSAVKVAYPFEVGSDIVKSVKLPGKHNLDNALAAIAAVACYKNISPDEFLSENSSTVIKGLANFKGLPHRLEFLRELDGVKIYDDNFSTNPSSTRVAINAFPDSAVTVIVGGRDKTDYEDLPEIYEILQAPQVKNIVLIGESGRELSKRYEDKRFVLADSLENALDLAFLAAKNSASTGSEKILLMSPSAASFDMFENVYDRGAQFKNLVDRLS